MLLALLAALLAPPTPSAPAHVELLGGWTCHTESDCQSGLAELSPSYRLRLTPHAEIAGDLVLTRPHGERDGRDSSTVGGGGDLRWRWHPLANAPLLDPFVEVTGGVVVHADPWPPGGSHYVLRRSWAIGLTLRPSPAFDLTLGVRQQHLSNGQGLGPHNPAFDGFGGFVGLGFLPHAVAHPLPGLLDEAARVESDAVVQAQLSLIQADGELGAAARAEARVALLRGLWTQVRVDAGRLVGLDFVGGELDLAWQGARGLIGATGGVHLFGGLIRRRVALQGEWYADRLSSVRAQAAWRVATLAADALDLRLVWRIHPTSWLALDLGYEYTVDDQPDLLARTAPVVGIELAPPWIGDHGFTLVAEREVDDLRVISLRYTGGAPADLRQRDRVGGLQPLR